MCPGAMELEEHERWTPLHNLAELCPIDIDGVKGEMVDAALGAGKEIYKGIVAPRRRHTATIPDTCKQLEVAQVRENEGVREVIDAFFVVHDRDENESIEAGHCDTILRVVPFPLCSVL